MDSLIEMIVKGEVTPKELISWLGSPNTVPILTEFEYLKADFVPYFLHFIREQTYSIVNSSTHTGLTPNKSTTQLRTTKFNSPVKFNKKPSANKKGFCTKAKTLNFADAALENVKIPSEHENNRKTPYRTPQKSSSLISPIQLSESPVNLQSFKSYKTSTPRGDQCNTFHQKRFDHSATVDKSDFNGSKVSERKNVLADYIVFESTKKSNKKKFREASKESKLKEVPFNLYDSDAFPVVGCNNNKKEDQKKRRINPTRVVDCEKTSSIECKKLVFGVPSKHAKDNFFLAAAESQTNSVDQERKLLREEIDKLQKTDCYSLKPFTIRLDSVDQCRTSLIANKSSLNTIYDEDSLSLVTFQQELKILADVYSSLILCSMVSNILVELYFLLQLLTAKEEFIEELSDNKFLNSPHNCIYFSVKTLSHLIDCLSLFDKSFIKALTENPRISAFDPVFKEDLLFIIDNSTMGKNIVKRHLKSPILSVSFQSETDNKNNFPDTLTFQTFKKQRDLFYELLRKWEDSHLTPGFNFNQSLGNKVKQIFVLQNGLTNLTHMARLFQSQLLTMCKGDERVDASSNVEDISFLNQLKKQNPEKCKKLYERLITPSKFGGPVPTPSFPGSQEFFKDFILNASNHSFNVHLKNVLITKITQLNEINCQLAELEDKEHGEHLKDEITSGVQSLRLLAKFLGFLEFLPYQTHESLPDLVVDNQMALRNKVVPPIPLFNMLKEGILSGCLVVVIPWMVELLSMVDSVAFHTQYYLTLIFELILIYKILYLFKYENKSNSSCNKCEHLKKLRVISSGNSLLLKLLIGWLLSLPNVPEGLFYVQEDEADINIKEFQSMKRLLGLRYFQLCSSCIRFTTSNDDVLEQREAVVDALCKEIGNFDFCSSPMETNRRITPMKSKDFSNKGKLISPMKTPSKFLKVSMIETPEGTPDKNETDSADVEAFSKLILDSYELVDYNTILLFCPFVHELKEVLNEFSLGSFRSVNGSSIRKITPLSAPDKVEDAPRKSLQNLLEENFFHNQASSTKKTVDFMVERIFSNVLRSLRSVVIPNLKDGCIIQIRSFVSSTVASVSLEKAAETVDKHVQQLSNELSVKIRQELIDQMNFFLDHNLQTSLQFLLPVDISKNSLDMCCQIVKRIVQEKVNSYVNSHLTTGFCTNELITEAHKYLKQTFKSLNNESTYNMESSLVLNTSNNLSGTNLHNNSSAGLGSILLEDQPSLDLSSSLSTNFVNVQQSKEVNKEYCPVAKVHNKQLIYPSRLLFVIKNDLRRLMILSEDIETYKVNAQERLCTIRQVLEERQDTTPAIVKGLQTLCADWMAALCICHPQSVTSEILKNFIELWTPSGEGLFPTPSILCVFLSARTIMLLGQKDINVQTLAWKKLEELLVKCIINYKLLSPAQLQDTLVALLRENWPKAIYDGLSTLIKGIVDAFSKSKEFSQDVESLQFSDWVGWVTSDMDV